ncbi:MAG: hypothetical protein CMH83_03855 [Nocardioides sp.]|nr:hypothetical protein [Nocardioides sp.]
MALSQVADELVADLAAICPWLSRRDLNAALDTCMDLDRGVPDVQGAVVEHARIRFSRGQNVPTEEQASALVAACLRHLDET